MPGPPSKLIYLRLRLCLYLRLTAEWEKPDTGDGIPYHFSCSKHQEGGEGLYSEEIDYEFSGILKSLSTCNF